MAVMVLIFGSMAALNYSNKFPMSSSERIGVVRVVGLIAESERTVDWIEELRRDTTISGVLIRIDSPGGVVGPSQEIFNAVRRLSKEKPTVVSMASVAASGGYYIACGADVIVANPGTLTGSIGVLSEFTDFGELLRKIGVRMDLIASGEFKGIPSGFQELTPAQRAYLKGIVMNLHGQFVNDIAESRDMPLDMVQKLADGKAMTGQQAYEAGLVDKLGGMLVAEEEIMALCELAERPEFVEQPKEKQPFLKELLAASGLDLNALISTMVLKAQ